MSAPARRRIRLVPHGSWRAVPATPSISPRALWAIATWLGFLLGLLESAVHLLWRLVEHRAGPPDLWVNWHKPWLAPLSLALLLFGLGLVLSLASQVLPRLTARLAPFALVGVGAWSVVGTFPGLNRWAAGLLVAGLTLRLARHARLDPSAFRRNLRATLLPASGLWLGLALTTGLWPALSESFHLHAAPRPPKAAPNILLVVLDTVRADSLSLYGYSRPTSPNLVAWSRRGVRFDQARATTPYTLGTHASLFTGHWMSGTSARVDAPLDGRWPTLAEHLRDRGYATAGFVGNIFYGSAHYGLDRGFSHYHDIPGNITRRVTLRELVRASHLGESLLLHYERKWRILAPMQRQRLDGAELNREALAWLDQTRPPDRPFFLFLNEFDAHSPYSLPAAAPQRFSQVPPDRLDAELKQLARLEERQALNPTPALAAELAAFRQKVNAHLQDAYDDGIAWADRQLDALLRGLDARGLLANTLVVITSDHGEMLGEHDLIGHGNSLHRPVVHVPLILIGAKGMEVPAGRGIDRPVSVRDVPATILHLAHDPDADRFPGRSLRRYWAADPVDPTDESPVLSEMEHLFWLKRSPSMPAASGPLFLLTSGRWSYHRQDHESRGLQEHLFDLQADPAEELDLVDEPSLRPTLLTLRAQFERARSGRR